MIGLGLALQRKVQSSEQLKGLKLLILSVALPATIFVALLRVDLSENMLVFPLVALAINGAMLGLTRVCRPVFGSISPSAHRTFMMLLPSFAPGLSCFPFIAEYLGDESVALAALADVGNKVFVLILLYFLAMHWYRQSVQFSEGSGNAKKLVGALFGEPINMVMLVALTMLGLGLNLQSLPGVVGEVILRLSQIMAPLILLFIGLAVKVTRKEFSLVFKALIWRSGLLFVISALILFIVPQLSIAMTLLVVVFPQSSCSFWPFAHMSTISAKENPGTKTFDLNLALSTLAISLPFSTVIILGAFSFQSVFINPVILLTAGLVMVIMTSLVPLIAYFRKHKVGTPNAAISQ